MRHPTAARHFQFFSPLLLWKLLLDIDHQQTGGPSCFENIEPGYLKSMFGALDHVFSHLGEVLTPDSFQTLHTHAIGHTQYRHSVLTKDGIIKMEEPFSQGFRHTTGTEFGLLTHGESRNCSEAGFIELLTKLQAGDDYFSINVENNEGQHIRTYDCNSTDIPLSDAHKSQLFQALKAHNRLVLSIPVCRPEKLNRRIQMTFDEYYFNIDHADTSNEKIRAIATCIHELELTHSFYDGNGRNNMLELMLKFLLENNLSPTLLFCADRFDAFSVDELCEEIKEGQRRFAVCKFSSTPPEGVLLHLEGNETLTHLVAHQIAACFTLWHDLDTDSQNRCVTIVQQIIEQRADKTFTYDQLQKLMTQIEEQLDSARISLHPVTVNIGAFKANLQDANLFTPQTTCFSTFTNTLIWAANKTLSQAISWIPQAQTPGA